MMAISQTLRFAVFDRDGFVCQYCGRRPPEVQLVLDHIYAVSLGGTDDVDNLITACEECNVGKGSRAVNGQDDDSSLQMRLSALEKRRDILEKCAARQSEILAAKLEMEWQILTRWVQARGGHPKKDGTWSASWPITNCVRGLLARLPFDEVLNCIDITLARMASAPNETDAIKYLYGVVKNRENLLSDTREH